MAQAAQWADFSALGDASLEKFCRLTEHHAVTRKSSLQKRNLILMAAIFGGAFFKMMMMRPTWLLS